MEPPPPLLLDLTDDQEAVTSTVNNDDTPCSESNNDSTTTGLCENQRDMIQSSCVSQSTASVGETDINSHVKSSTNSDSEGTKTKQPSSKSESDNKASSTIPSPNGKTDASTSQHDKHRSANDENSETNSNDGTVIIKRSKFEIKAKQYLRELQNSETDEHTENVKRLEELQNGLNENDKVK